MLNDWRTARPGLDAAPATGFSARANAAGRAAPGRNTNAVAAARPSTEPSCASRGKSPRLLALLFGAVRECRKRALKPSRSAEIIVQFRWREGRSHEEPDFQLCVSAFFGRG